MLKWGYFPETRQYDVDRLMEQKTEVRLLWAARMIDWKHPELPVKTAKYLKEKGYSFHLDMIGGGELEKETKALVEQYGLQEGVSFPGYCPPEKVRELMEKASILSGNQRQAGGLGSCGK